MNQQPTATANAARAVIVVITLIALAAATCWVSLAAGPWYDEFYTAFVTRPDRGWVEALTQSWLADNHPPFFYVLIRATGWLGSLEAHRLVNLGVGALAAAGGWTVVRSEPRLQAVAAPLILLLAANIWTLRAATELRSYFISLCVGALLSLVLAAIWLAPERGARARQAVYAASVMVAFNTHIVTTLTACGLVAPYLAAAVLRRDGARLRALAPAPILAALVFAAVTAFQLGYWQRNTQAFWIAGGLEAAVLSAKYAVLRTLEASPLVLLGSLCGSALLIRETMRLRKLPETAIVCLLGVAGLALALALLVGVHLMRPILVERYLVAMVGALTCLMALACERALEAVPHRIETVLLALTLCWSTLALAQNARAVAGRPSWLGTGRLIARVQARCPDATARTDPFWNADVMAMPPRDNRRVVPWAYQEVAMSLGLHMEPPGSRRLSATCPNLFWAEHQAGQPFDEASVLRHIQGSGLPVRAITLYRIGRGWIASDRPLSEAVSP